MAKKYSVRGDRAKCAGTNCPLKAKCLRFLAPENPERQNYLSGVPFDWSRRECDYYLPTNQS